MSPKCRSMDHRFQYLVLARVRDPVEVVLRERRGGLRCMRVGRSVEERIGVEGLGPHALARVGPRAQLARQRVLREPGRPRLVEPLLERAALVRPVRVVVAGRDDGADARQVRGMRDGGQHLGGAHVGPAEHADLAVRVGQGRCPLHRVVPVVRLVLERVPLALGRVPPAHVLDDDDVAARRGHHAESVAAVLVVRRALEKDGERAVGPGAVDVGLQRHAVPHLDRHARLERHRELVVGPAGNAAVQQDDGHDEQRTP